MVGKVGRKGDGAAAIFKQLVKARFKDGGCTALQFIDYGLVFINASDPVAQVAEGEAGGEAEITGADDDNTKFNNLFQEASTLFFCVVGRVRKVLKPFKSGPAK